MIDVDSLTAIDVHAHVEVSAVSGRGSLSPELATAAEEYFGIKGPGRPTIHEITDYYRERSMAAVVFTVDCTMTMGVPPIPSDEMADAVTDPAGHPSTSRRSSSGMQTRCCRTTPPACST